MPFAGYADFADCVAQNQDKDDPEAYCAVIKRQVEGEALRHPDFQRIFNEFKNYYCKLDEPCPEAYNQYYEWLDALSLDETLAYGAAYESFRWAKNMISYLREDDNYKYYKVLVGFPIKSMNGNVYKERDLIGAALTLKGLHPNLNHKNEWHFTPESQWGEVTAVDARYEDGAIEAIIKVSKSAICPICDGKPVTELIDGKKIVNVSLQGGCANSYIGGVCDGFQFDEKGFSLLTSDVLPGIPMARIFPMEAYMPKILSQSPSITVGAKKIKVRVKTMRRKEATIDPEDPNKPVDKSPTTADDQGQCPEGQRWSEDQGKCVPDTSCPEGQVWDDALGQCKPIPESEPEGTEVVVGTPASHDTSTRKLEQELASEDPCPEGQYWDPEQQKCLPVPETEVTPIEQDTIEPGSHYCEEHPEDPRCKAHKKDIHGEQEGCPEGQIRDPESGLCIDKPVPQEMQVSDECPEGQYRDPQLGQCVPIPPVDITPPVEQEIPEPPKTCPENQHWDADANQCVPDELMTTAEIARHKTLDESVKRKKAERRAAQAEKNAEYWEREFLDMKQTATRLLANVKEKVARIHQLERKNDRYNLAKIADQVTIKDFKRRIEDLTMERDNARSQKEKFVRLYNEAYKKYQKWLGIATELQQNVTKTNEDFLHIHAEKEKLEAALKRKDIMMKKGLKVRAKI